MDKSNLKVCLELGRDQCSWDSVEFESTRSICLLILSLNSTLPISACSLQ